MARTWRHGRGRWSRALVTGASAGIGEAFARRLAEDGVELVLVARRQERLEILAEELHRRWRIPVEVVPADVTDENQLGRIERRLEDYDRPIDLLVNNAGGHDSLAPLVDQNRDVLTRDAELNAVAVLRLTHAALGGMVARRGGDVIQVSSGTAFSPTPGQAVYAASKAFINHFSSAVNHELRGTGVHICVICPGFTRTDGPARQGFSDQTVARAMWTDPDKVVLTALRAAARRGRTIHSPRLLDKALGRLSYYGPRPIVIRAMATTMRPVMRATGDERTAVRA